MPVVFTGLRILPRLALVAMCAAVCASAAAEYDGGPVTSGSTVSGVVRWQGSLPEPLVFQMNTDEALCGGDQKTVTVLHVDEKTRVVQGALVYLDRVSSGKELSDAGVNTAMPLCFQNCVLEPALTVRPVRDMLKIRNFDTAVHNLRVTGPQGFISEMDFSLTGDSKYLRLPYPGFYQARCTRHPWEYATALAIEQPYYAQTDGKGRFRMSDVPPGQYNLVLWLPPSSAEPRFHGGMAVDYRFAPPRATQQRIRVAAGTDREVTLTASDAP